MKKLGEIMHEMGFRKEGSRATKEAFIKYLLRSAEGIHVMTPTEVEIIRQNQHKIRSFPRPERVSEKLPEQLSFNFEDPKKDQNSA